jgi:hypothetical protein
MLAAGTITASNLSILGDFVTLNTITSNTEQMVIQNAGTGPALKVTQTGAHPIADFYDDGQVLAMRIADGGNVGIGTANPQSRLHVVGNIKANGVHQVLEIDLQSQTNTTFYPIHLDNAPAMYTHYFSIEMPSQAGSVSYNMHSLHAIVRSAGWTDQRVKFEVFHNFHDDAERSILGIYGGINDFYGTIIYLRGGQKYTFVTNSQTLTRYTSAVTLGNAPNASTFALKNVSGVDISGTSVNILQHWSGMTPAGKTLSHSLYVNGGIKMNLPFAILRDTTHASTPTTGYTLNWETITESDTSMGTIFSISQTDKQKIFLPVSGFYNVCYYIHGVFTTTVYITTLARYNSSGISQGTETATVCPSWPQGNADTYMGGSCTFKGYAGDYLLLSVQSSVAAQFNYLGSHNKIFIKCIELV